MALKKHANNKKLSKTPNSNAKKRTRIVKESLTFDDPYENENMFNTLPTNLIIDNMADFIRIP